ncbi:MAG TPA: ice-binding family protein, partial [Gammaproteobacteria bacterium]|nr:ice-binding family protein [Gammaproteobacteria bacterium]
MQYLIKFIKITFLIAALAASQISFALSHKNNSSGIITISAPSPAMSNMACSATPVARTFDYTVRNTGGAPLDLYDIDLDTNSADTFTGLPAPSLAGCAGILGAYTSCILTLSITPPTCVAESQSLSQVLDRTIVIRIHNNIQPQLTEDVNAAVTTLGSGADFSAIGPVVLNSSPGLFGPAQMIGNVAATSATAVDATQFDMIQGSIYAYTDDETINANNDLLSAYNTFNKRKTAIGCGNHGNITTGQVFNSGYYCMTSSPTVTVGGAAPITFAGPGKFVFFVPAGINLTFLNNAEFIYENGASKDNVYWIAGSTGGVTTGVVTLTHGNGTAATPGAMVDGTILSNGLIVADAVT